MIGSIFILSVFFIVVESRGALLQHFRDSSCKELWGRERDDSTMEWQLLDVCISDDDPYYPTSSKSQIVYSKENRTSRLEFTIWYNTTTCSGEATRMKSYEFDEYDKCIEWGNTSVEWFIVTQQESPEKLTKYKDHKILTSFGYYTGKNCEGKISSASYYLLGYCINTSVSPFHPSHIKRYCREKKLFSKEKEYVEEYWDRYITDCLIDPSDRDTSDVGVCKDNGIFFC